MSFTISKEDIEKFKAQDKAQDSARMYSDIEPVVPWVYEALDRCEEGNDYKYHTDYFYFIYYLWLAQRPKVTVETGTGQGFSDIAMVAAGETIRYYDKNFDYHITTVDNSPGEGYYQRAVGYVIPLLNEKCGNRVKAVVIDDADHYKHDGPIDFLYLDDGHWPHNIRNQLANLSGNITVGGVILIDDIHEDEAVPVREFETLHPEFDVKFHNQAHRVRNNNPCIFVTLRRLK